MTDPSKNAGGPGSTGPSANDQNSQSNSNPLLTAALLHAAAGRPVLPLHTPVFPSGGGPPVCSCRDPKCDSIGKHPRTVNGLKDATTDEATIRRWWDLWPGANVGMMTGPTSGLVALDIDPRHGGDHTLAELEARHGALAHTVTALTGGGGLHKVLVYPGFYIKSRTIAPGLDVKGDGGYIVVEPSLHVSGRRYAWELSSLPDETPAAAIPPWLLEMMREPAKASSKPTGTAGAGPIREGQRNSTLISLAGAMRHRGMSAESILAALRAENQKRCQPPLDDAEVQRTAASAASYEPGAPVPWEPPLPLFAEPEGPEFPLAEAFPDSLSELREFVAGLAEELQVPVDLIALLLIAIAAAALAKKFEIEVRPGWREIAAIWVLVLLDSGERKSVAFRRLTDPVLEWEKDEAERLGPDLAAALEEREIVDQQRKNERKKAGQGDANARQRAKELAQQLAAMKEVLPPTLITTDATSEALVGLMFSNGERALVASPEGDALDVLLGRYDEKARPNMGVWLKGYSGDRVRVHRRGRPPEFLDKPALSVAMTVQHEAVRGMFASRAARGRGLLARFFVSSPRPMIGRRKIGAAPVVERLEVKYTTTIRRVLDLPIDADLGPRIVRLDPGASALFTEFETRVEKELGDSGSLGERRDWGAKLCGGILRIALVLHGLELYGGGCARSAGSAQEVSVHTMRAALAWAPYLIEHERLATSIVGCDQDSATADRILRWLSQTDRDTFTRRDCFTACRGRTVKQVEDIDGALHLLDNLGYIRRLPDPAAGPQGGRRPSPTYEVNPLWERGGVQ